MRSSGLELPRPGLLRSRETVEGLTPATRAMSYIAAAEPTGCIPASDLCKTEGALRPVIGHPVGLEDGCDARLVDLDHIVPVVVLRHRGDDRVEVDDAEARLRPHPAGCPPSCGSPCPLDWRGRGSRGRHP